MARLLIQLLATLGIAWSIAEALQLRTELQGDVRWKRRHEPAENTSSSDRWTCQMRGTIGAPIEDKKGARTWATGQLPSFSHAINSGGIGSTAG
ncbi:hypothetical protein [Bradyrhizobium sp. STM 3809]|uniref:hypothetical protein n=1 Tax=Bradyrhizobium sp. STM 3809 TaxID=551936 RepID=UPI00024097C9|nr:hypothetical protein [Bradyrhizobium sp. STM 3809]CCE01241.1 hypothetical protein BRAS3809_4460011 [Bradyrhizobium sp. STM 3809]